uniref:hypothetical protein n=1 Tax=Algoriphagus sp. TaxID=1872435 RepID=UPI0025DD90F8
MSKTIELNKIILGIFSLSFLMLTACELEPNDRIDPAAQKFLSNGINENQNLQDFSKLEELLNKTNSKLQSGSETARRKGLGSRTDLHYQEIVRQLLQVVNPSPCGPTAYTNWLDEENSDWSNISINFANLTLMYELPTYDALLFENSNEDQYFGKDGEYTQSVNKTFKDLKRFWDIDSNEI